MNLESLALQPRLVPQAQGLQTQGLPGLQLPERQVLAQREPPALPGSRSLERLEPEPGWQPKVPEQRLAPLLALQRPGRPLALQPSA